MSAARTLQRSFARGEITPELIGRVDLVAYQTGLKTCRNFITLPHGPAQTRAGTKYVIETKDSTKRSRLIPFSYNTQQTYIVELGDQYMRFHTNSGTVLEAAKNITGITQPAGVITSAAHGYTNGDWVFISGVGGMTELNGRYAVVSDSAANTFRIKDFAGNYITTDGYGAYTTGGTAARVYTVSAPYLENDLFDIKYEQSADVLTLVHPSYAVRELRRLSASSFQLSTVAFSPGISAITTSAQPVPTPGTSATIKNITGITRANPGVITSVAHGFAVGSYIYIRNVSGMTEISERSFIVNTVPTADTFTVKTTSGTVVDTSAYSAYVSGGQIFGDTLYKYRVTAVSSATQEESLASADMSCVNNLTLAGAKNTLNWSMDPAAVRYRVYLCPDDGGVYGFIGESATGQLTDDNIAPDFTRTPPEDNNPFSGANNYPSAVSYHEQRRCFANTNNKPQHFWLTRSGTESNLTYSIPSQDDDAIIGRAVAREVNAIRHFVPLDDLMVLTAGGEWTLTPGNADFLSPATLKPMPIGYVGCSNVRPIVAGATIMFVQESGSRMYSLAYRRDENGLGYKTADISIMAPHLFEGHTISDLAWAKAPTPTAWAVSSSGDLLGCTYIEEHDVLAWHHHDTEGTFESIAAISEAGGTARYVIAQRSLNGRTARCVERFASQTFSALDDWFGVDCGLTYSGAAAATITGLWHLEGETVAILADGAVQPRQTVSNGRVTLQQAASKVHVGLAYECELETLPLVFEADSAVGRGRAKNVSRVFLRVHRSTGMLVGPDGSTLVEPKLRTTEVWGSPPSLQTKEIEVVLPNSWNRDGGVLVRQVDPVPLTVLSMALEVAVGG